MADASNRAARSPKRGGLTNALFVVAAAEALPRELDRMADAVTVHFPWGSLLRGLLTAEPSILSNVARVARPDADLSVLLSVTERDRIDGIDTIDDRLLCSLAPAYAGHGLTMLQARRATPDEIARSHSSWAKRLDAGAARPVWRRQFRRCPQPHE